MPSVQSKDQQNDEEEFQLSPEKKRTVFLINTHMAVNMALSILTFNTRTLLLQQLTNNDTTLMAKYLSNWAMVIGGWEFLFNPTIGRLSDTYGRKFWMTLSPVICTFLKGLVLINPSLFTISLEKIVCDGLRVICGTTQCGAALTDIYGTNPKTLAKAYGRLLAGAGISILASPVIAGFLEQRFTWRGPYAVTVALAGLLSFFDYFYLEETVNDENRRPYKGFSSPFDVFKLFTMDKNLAIISSSQILNYIGEAKNLGAVNQLYQMEQLEWKTRSMSLFTSMVGLGLFMNGPVSKFTLTTFGSFGHTTFTNMISIIEMLMKGYITTTTSMWLGQCLGLFGASRTLAMKAQSTQLAMKNGFGKGEYQGLWSNLRALCGFLAPFVWGNLYISGTTRGNPGLPYKSYAVILLLSELLNQWLRMRYDNDSKNQ